MLNEKYKDEIDHAVSLLKSSEKCWSPSRIIKSGITAKQNIEELYTNILRENIDNSHVWIVSVDNFLDSISKVFYIIDEEPLKDNVHILHLSKSSWGEVYKIISDEDRLTFGKDWCRQSWSTLSGREYEMGFKYRDEKCTRNYKFIGRGTHIKTAKSIEKVIADFGLKVF